MKTLYTAVILDDYTRENLTQEFYLPYGINNEWKWYAHHMTINMGEAKPIIKQFLGTKQILVVTHIGKSNECIALKVKGFKSYNDIPHVTLAVNVKNGGRPVMSNMITDWKPLEVKYGLSGIVTEVKSN